ncbi:methyl-accepting chemotaxis protein [Paenibacillus cellulosilyticus]|uniref:Methyl-accepting chemotaxis protein n=1 Tax=Paenibacillus cellulosilyticus TaxID=375489 RepID=A0A2V2YD32_9BACL|nr:methyl-accepting chemotaxis protein [Paenibacillus cellulosilyticus]PWV89377.1 methyl-accepting chemotaxis protein [Paenibacillus cellulosilyticus]QKS43128.1 methyl-accepting chemotaxis protein [Paenibacillus cellulosilyticus]
MKLSFRTKVIGLIAIPFLLYIGTSIYYPLYVNTTVDKLKQQLYTTSYTANNEIMNADRDVYQALFAYTLIDLGNLTGKELEDAVKDYKDNIQQANDRMANARELMEKAGLLNITARGADRPVSALFKDFADGFNAWAEDTSQAIQSGKHVNEDVTALFLQGRSGIDTIGNILDENALISLQKIEDDNNSSQKSMIIQGSLIVIVVVILMYIVMRRLGKSVRSAASKTSRIMQGDLTVESEAKYSSDEMGAILKSTDAMIGNLKSMIGGIIDNASKVADSSVTLHTASRETADSANHIAEHIQEVTNGTELQARGAEETSRAIEEMAIGINRIADNTSEMASQSTDTSSYASEGRESLDHMIGQMNEMKETLTLLAQSIQTLENHSGTIGKIADEITAFASQTNILSLNASIEAARAGEHGKGFAVVAGEIRKLASQSFESADSIRELVTATKEDITEAADSMNKTLVEVEKSGQTIEVLDNQFKRISDAIEQMAEQLQENSAIAEQMSASAEQVSASMEQSSRASSDNLGKIQSVAAATEEQLALMGSMAESAVQLKEIVGDLSRAVSYFKVN